MPQPWPKREPPRVAHDGSQRTIRFRVLGVNVLEQTDSREVRLEKWIADKLVVAENYVLHGNLYLKQELMLMLKVAGFKEVFVRGNYTDEAATPEHDELVFTAIR